MPAERAVALVCHPESRAGAVRGVRAHVLRSADGALAVAFTIEGDIARLRVPPPVPPHFADGLWQRTCCEVFARRRGAAGYHEFNLSPSGAWAAYAFRGYRERTDLEAAPAAAATDVAKTSAAGSSRWRGIQLQPVLESFVHDNRGLS